MAVMWNFCLPEIKRDLLYASKECSERGLVNSAKWSAELAASLPAFTTSECLPQTVYSDEQFVREFDKYTLAKTYFDLKGFNRAAVCVEDCTSSKAYFFHVYAKYWAGEKRKGDIAVDFLGSHESIRNEYLPELRAELCQKHKELDGFCLYLYGVVLKKLDLKKKAIDVLYESVNKEPLHWGAWQELASLITDKETLQSLSMPNHWMTEFFKGHVALELQNSEDGLQLFTALSNAGFSQSSYIRLQMALAHYHNREFDASIELFKDLRKTDPFMIEHMDTYSNILYVKELKPELSHLAHDLETKDKFREETCCVIGNYYSLRGNHEKAVVYFQRALRLNPQYTSAYTLMGHEFMEIKNTSAAIEAYRKAIDVNCRDYRAWYGLGQTYEILKMPFYCLYYYKQAQRIRPNDSRMWVALGESYEKLKRNQEAKKCYFRANSVGDLEGIAVFRLARLHEKLEEIDEAAKYFHRYVEQSEAVGVISMEDLCFAYKFLARYYLNKGDLEQAEQFAHKCYEHNELREEGKSLLRQISHARSAGENQSSSDLFTLAHLASDRQSLTSPSLDPVVSPMNLNFNTPG